MVAHTSTISPPGQGSGGIVWKKSKKSKKIEKVLFAISPLVPSLRATSKYLS
jgi:hypothetical protein